MKILLLLLTLTVTLSLPLTACSSESYGEGYNKGFEEGYNKGWQAGYNEGVEKAPSVPPQIQTPSSPEKTAISLEELTLEDADYILNFLPFLPATFEKVDSASEGMSNADLELGDDVSEVELFISEEPFQTIWGILMISESRIERASWDSIMNDEEQISNLIVQSIMAGAIEEGIEIQEPIITIIKPDIGDSAIFGEGYIDAFGLIIGFDTLWFRVGKAYVVLYSSYYSVERESLFPIAIEVEQRITQYSP